MVSNDFRLKMVSKAAVYSYMRRKHIVKRRWFVAAESFAVATVVVLSAALQVYLEIKPPTYKLDEATYGLIGESRDDADQYLTEDLRQSSYKFAVPKEQESEPKEHAGRNYDTYEADLPKQAKQGITYTDTQSKIDITLTPNFYAGEGKKIDGGHIVYPMGDQKLIYTLKYNGLKEDIVVPKYTSDELTYEFKLSLPSGVEARIDAQGNIGIFSSDPNLFGNISFGTDEDRAKIDKAREKGEKNNLVATIPSPIIKDARGTEYNDRSKFILGDRQLESANSMNKNLPAEVREQLKGKQMRAVYNLTISSTQLGDLPYPISIDPTITTTSASDFNKGANEGGVEIDATNGLIKRSPLTGGTFGSWSANTTMVAQRQSFGVAVYNGYIYATGGSTANSLSAVATTEYATISDAGVIGTWASTSSMTTERQSHTTFAFNGYIYAIGGSTSSSVSAVATTEYAPINANGTIGTWATTTSMNVQRQSHGSVVSGGYVYAVGGSTSDAVCGLSSTEYAQINGNGTLGTWTNGTSMSSQRESLRTVVYNEFVYATGGATCSGSGAHSTTEVAKIGSNGVLGSWSSAAALPAQLQSHTAAVYNGYMYLMGGSASTAISGAVNTYYAPIFGDGSIGTWRSATSASAQLQSHAAVAHKGYIITLGGSSSDSTSATNATSYTTIKPAGVLQESTWSTASNNFATSRFAAGTVVYNGYIYVIGGCTIDSQTLSTCSNVALNGATSNVQFAAIQSSGNIGAWASTTASLPAPRWSTVAVAYNGVIYVIGGCEAAAITFVCVTMTSTFYAVPNSTTGQISSWSTNSTNTLGTGVREAAGTAYNGYIYVTGGRNSGATAQNIVQYAPVSSSGITGNFANTTTTFSGTRYLHSTFAYNGYLYVGNGSTGPSNHLDLQRAAIASNGNITASWSTQSNFLSDTHSSYLFVNNGYLYYMPGGSTNMSYARISPTDGSVDTLVSTQAKPIANQLATTGGFAYNGFIYVIGGCTTIGGSDQCTAKTTVPYYQALNNGGAGTVSSWTTDADTFTNRHSHSAVALNSYLYLMGGCITDASSCSANHTANVQYAAIASDGTVGTFASTTQALPEARMSGAAVVANGRIYFIGGTTTSSTYRTTSYYDTPSSTGDITSWSTLTATLATAKALHGAAFSQTNGYIYVTGGSPNGVGASDTTEYGLVTSSGDISSWTLDSGGNYSNARLNPGVVINNGYLYVVAGGGDGSCSTTYNFIDYAPLNADGSVGAWTRAKSFMIFNRQALIVTAMNGYLYATSGCQNGGGVTSSVEFAPILPNGDIGLWQATQAAPSAQLFKSGAYFNGRMYVTGGHNSFVFNNQVQYTSLQSISRSGAYARLFDFQSGVKPLKLISRGSKRAGATAKLDYRTTNNNTTTFANSQSIRDVGYTAVNAHNFNLGTSITLSRLLLMRYIIDETESAVFPDSGTNETTLTDFDIYFDPNPGARLRGGRTFVNGLDRGLDASP